MDLYFHFLIGPLFHFLIGLLFPFFFFKVLFPIFKWALIYNFELDFHFHFILYYLLSIDSILLFQFIQFYYKFQFFFIQFNSFNFYSISFIQFIKFLFFFPFCSQSPIGFLLIFFSSYTKLNFTEEI